MHVSGTTRSFDACSCIKSPAVSSQYRSPSNATNPVPGAFTIWKNEPLKVLRVQYVEQPASELPGTIVMADPRKGLIVATNDGGLLLQEVQPAGKTTMDGAAFVRGHGIVAGSVFGR